MLSARVTKNGMWARKPTRVATSRLPGIGYATRITRKGNAFADKSMLSGSRSRTGLFNALRRPPETMAGVFTMSFWIPETMVRVFVASSHDRFDSGDGRINRLRGPSLHGVRFERTYGGRERVDCCEHDLGCESF